MNRYNFAWGATLIASSIYGIIITSCADISEIESWSELRPWVSDVDHDGYKSNGQLRGADCNDLDARVYPGAVELCDGIDNNCDGAIDEEITRKFFLDHDNDGHGDIAELILSCIVPDGYVEDENDCDDADPLTYAGAPEVCDGRDNSCDGRVDEDLAVITSYRDRDSDGYGNSADLQSGCAVAAGYVDIWGDCNDDASDIHPSAPELCNGIDDDCDEAIDDGLLMPYYVDADSDSYGVGLQDYIISCTPIPGRTTNNWDCDDSNPEIHPNNLEHCDGIDENCNKLIDEQWWAYNQTLPAYLDYDHDGFGDPATQFYGCLPPDLGTLEGGDCDDSSASINPDATETCNGIDDDCDGATDEPDMILNTGCTR